MGDMLFFPECVYHEGVDSAEGFDGCVRHCFGVGDVGEGADAESQDVNEIMIDGEREDLVSANCKRNERLDDMVDEDRGSGIMMLRIAIRDAGAEVAVNVGLAVDVEAVGITVGSEVVDAADMVVVGVCNEKSVNVVDRVAQELLTNVRTGVDEDVCAAD